MSTSQITITLPESSINFLEKYAQKNYRTVSELINDYVTLLKKVENYTFHPDIEKYAGFLPADLDMNL